MPKTRRRSRPGLWAYDYLIVPPQSRGRLAGIRTILDLENTSALGAQRVWTGRLVLERRITHILVVSDDPGQNLGINHRLEAELRRLNAVFLATLPMAILSIPEPSPEPGALEGPRPSA